MDAAALKRRDEGRATPCYEGSRQIVEKLGGFSTLC